MKNPEIALKELKGFLLDCKNDLSLFTTEEAAYECSVTSQTVRNFENGTCTNSTLLLYYLLKAGDALKLQNIDAHFKECVHKGTWEEYDYLEFIAYYSLSALNSKLSTIFGTNDFFI